MKLQTWLFKQADKPIALFAVFFLTVCESVFLFIPPEVFMTPPIISNRKNVWWVIALTSLGSLIGGIITYFIGMYMFDSVGVYLIETFSNPEKFEHARQLFTTYGFLVILISAFTPVPYKLVALAAGFLGINAWLFIGMSGIFRSMRFAIVGYFLWKYQASAKDMIMKHFWTLTIGAILLMLLGVVALTLI